jgi:hypothetical protein
MKHLISVLLVLLLLVSVVSAKEIVEEQTLYDDEFDKIAQEGIYDDIGDVELEGSAGMTPDSAFYFLEDLLESMLVGDNPETALQYKEEKILELKEMVESGNKEAVEKALERVEKYNDILQREVSPELDKRVRESSKATKEVLNSFDLEKEGWDDIKDTVNANLKQEDKIALAAKISNKISELCRALSGLDPLEYSKVCKTNDDAPEWKKNLDRELTEEQEKEAKEFFAIMSECFKNPEICRCEEISIKPFADKCGEIAPLASKCEAGSEDACRMMEEIEDPIDLLPDYLRDVMEDIENQYGESKHDLHVPSECVEAGALSREACMKVMFKTNAPPECQDALESGKIDPQNENEARKACDSIMFNLEAPEECKEAGLKDFRECETYMFKLDAPQECLDAGLSGSGRDDWKKCELIRFKLDAPKECLDAGIDGSHRDDWKKCDAIRFRLDSPKECLDAGLTGEGRDDWKKCNKITFLLDAPEECHKFADERDPWKKCQPVQFKLDAHPACLEAGLTGEGRNDWDDCQKIQFKAEAPQECLDAGLTGEGRRDWDECHKLQEKTGQNKEDCGPNELHICEDGNCYCTSDSNKDCSAVDCQQGYHCEYGKCFPDGGSCGDCNAKCPGSSGTNCVNGQCECYYDDKVDDNKKESECNDGCSQECGDQNTDCVDGKCVCTGYGPNGPPSNGDDDGSSGSADDADSGDDGPTLVDEPDTSEEPSEPESSPEESDNSESDDDSSSDDSSSESSDEGGEPIE